LLGWKQLSRLPTLYSLSTGEKMPSETIILGLIIIGLLLLILIRIPKTNRKYDYIQLAAQEGKATFSNGQWLGSMKMDGKTADAKLFASCPAIESYISELGTEGWNLISIIERVVDRDKNLYFQTYYFKKAK
jgi:LPXTG-motif cell wall-anchored protein